MQWEAAVANLERAEMTRQRSGREPRKRVGACSCETVEVIPQLQVGFGLRGGGGALGGGVG